LVSQERETGLVCGKARRNGRGGGSLRKKHQSVGWIGRRKHTQD